MRRRCPRGIAYVCFGLGVLITFCLPTWFLVFVLCVLVISGGVFLFR